MVRRGRAVRARMVERSCIVVVRHWALVLVVLDFARG
jgi:hypothetical protein